MDIFEILSKVKFKDSPVLFIVYKVYLPVVVIALLLLLIIR